MKKNTGQESRRRSTASEIMLDLHDAKMVFVSPCFIALFNNYGLQLFFLHIFLKTEKRGDAVFMVCGVAVKGVL